MLNKKILTGVYLLIFILILVSVIFVADMFIEDNRVIVKGKVQYNAVSGWSVTYNTHSVQKDTLFDITFYYMPWETKDILILVTLQNTETNTKYNGETWLGSGNLLYTDFNFDVNIHHVPTGTYTGRITVYEVEKDNFGIFEQNRVQRATTTFEVTVIP